MLCNQCFRSGNGDGLSAIQWLNEISFVESIKLVADHLGIQPNKNGKHKSKNSRHKSDIDPAEHLEFQPWNEDLIALWCLWKPPITSAAVLAVGGRLARYRDQHTVIAIPVLGEHLDQKKPVGWCLYNVTGGNLPVYTKKGDGYDVTWKKVKLTSGSRPGVMCDLTRLRAETTTTLVKVEGPSDLLAMLSMGVPLSVCPLTNANGCGEIPLDWICNLFANKQAWTIHDCDKPGQAGAATWSQSIACQASECRNVVLPYPISENHGKDLRDYTGSNTWSTLETLAKSFPPIDNPQSPKISALEHDDDPHRLARINLKNYAERGGRTIRYWRDEWYVWRETNYRRISEKELRAKISFSCKSELDRICIERLKSGEDNEPQPAKKVTAGLVTNVLQATTGMTILSSQIETMSLISTREKRPFLALRNGIIDIDAVMEDRDEYLIPHSPDWFSTVCLPYKFDKDATCPKWEAFLERNLELDPQRIKLLQEWAGYLLLPDTGLQRFLVLEGEGANGKSVYCAAIEAMLGRDNCSHVPLELFGEKFELTSTLDKLVNICGDAGELDKVAEGHIKAFTAGNPMSFGRKYLEPIERTPTARLMMAVNNRPKFSDRSDAVWRRMLLVPWQIQIPVEDRIPNMDKPWWWEKTGELPGIFLWAIKGLHRLRRQGKFTYSDLCEEALNEYRAEMNPARRFLAEFVTSGNSRIHCANLYHHYVRWSKENGHTYPLSEQHFGKEVARSFRGCKKIRPRNDSVRTWMYEGIAYSTDRICGEHVEPEQLF